MNDRQREFTKSQRFKNNNHNRAPNPSCLLRDGPRYLTRYHQLEIFLPRPPLLDNVVITVVGVEIPGCLL